MESWERKYILRNMAKLIEQTRCNTTLMATLMEKGVLSEDDTSTLDAISNEREKTKTLYNIALTKKGSYGHLIFALEKGRQTGAVWILNQLGAEEEVENRLDASETASFSKRRKVDKTPFKFEVLAPVANFNGRKSELVDLHQKLQGNERKHDVNSHIVSVVGTGGIGKTELARKYAQEYGEEYYDGNVVWINAQNEGTLRKSFAFIFNIIEMNVNKKEMDIEAMVDRVYRKTSKLKALFIFDDAENAEYLHKYLPLRQSSSSSPPHILITSRDREWSLGTEALELGEWEEEEAICFVQTGLKIENNDNVDEVIKLARRLQCFPLALSQAVSFIKQRRMLRNFSINEYLELFEKSSEKLLNSKKSPSELNTYRDTTFTTWRVTKQQIASDEENGECAMQILNSIAYYLPNQIPISIFANLSDGDEYRDALQLLVKYSMLNVSIEDETVSINQLIQEVTRFESKINNQDELALRTALQLVSWETEDNFDEDLLYHIVAAYKCSFDVNTNLSVEFKNLPWRIVRSFNLKFRWEEAKTVGKELAALLCKILVSQNDHDLIKLQLELAEVERKLEDDIESSVEGLERLHKICVKNKENSFTENHLLEVRSVVVRYYQKMGRYGEALKRYRKTFEQQKTLPSLNNHEAIDKLIKLAKSFLQFGMMETSTEMSAQDWTELNSAFSFVKKERQTKLGRTENNFCWSHTIYNVAYCLYEKFDTDYAINIINDLIQRSTKFPDSRFSKLVTGCLAFLCCPSQRKKEKLQ